MNVTVTGYGAFLAKKGKRLVIKKEGKQTEFPIINIDSVFVDCYGTSFSSNLVYELKDFPVEIVFFKNDTPIAYLDYFFSRDPNIKRKQYLLSDEKKVHIIQKLLWKKIQGQLSVLKSLTETGLITNIDHALELSEIIFQELKKNSLLDNIEIFRRKTFACEAQFANDYWKNLCNVIDPKYNFFGREKRQARDSFNASLNYAYAILASKILFCLTKASLDPTCGFLHTDLPKRNSLVYDIIEPFRPMADRAILTLFTKKIFDIEKDFDMQVFLLSRTGKEKVSEKMTNLFEKKFFHKGRDYSFKSLLQFTAYSLRDFIADEKKEFEVELP